MIPLSRDLSLVSSARSQLDTITTSILWNRITSVLDEAAATLVRSAFSPVVREANDFACVLPDSQGRPRGQSSLSLPSFLRTTPMTIREFIRRFPPEALRPGDVLITNNPWIASGHLPDVTMAMPIFNGHRLVAFAGCCAHMSDMGG